MTLIKKSDAKNYFSARQLPSLHAVRFTAKQPKRGLAVIDPITAGAKELSFISDFSQEHSSPGGTVTAVVIVTAEDSQTPELPRDPKH